MFASWGTVAHRRRWIVIIAVQGRLVLEHPRAGAGPKTHALATITLASTDQTKQSGGGISGFWERLTFA